jgi:hypothetical protein
VVDADPFEEIRAGGSTKLRASRTIWPSCAPQVRSVIMPLIGVSPSPTLSVQFADQPPPTWRI